MSTILDALAAALRQEWPSAPPGAHGRVLAALCARCGGERLYVPSRPPGAAAARLADELADGATMAAAARAAGVTVRHAYRLRARRTE